MISAANRPLPLSGNKIKMMSRFKIYCTTAIALLLFVAGMAQTTTPLKVAVFAPVYLDSAFDAQEYKHGNNALPRIILPGLEFYNGIMLAVDSLNTERHNLEVYFYDTKSVQEPLEKVLDNELIKQVSLIIASFNTRSEIKPLAAFAQQQRIPLISMTYPNDGGLSANPYFALVNPTLGTHIEALYKYMHRTYPTEPITLFKRKGAAEDMIAGMLADMNKKTPGLPLKIKTVELTDSFSTDQVLMQLDSTRQNIVFCSSLNENFGSNLVKVIASSKSYKAVTIGMPTWDAIRDLGRDAEIIYTTPYNYSRTDKLGQYINTTYRSKYIGRPSDMVYKGFEALYHFGRLLLKHQNKLIDQLSDKDFKLFNEYDFQPVKLRRDSFVADYLENKKVYFVRKLDGQIKSVQ